MSRTIPSSPPLPNLPKPPQTQTQTKQNQNKRSLLIPTIPFATSPTSLSLSPLYPPTIVSHKITQRPDSPRLLDNYGVRQLHRTASPPRPQTQTKPSILQTLSHHLHLQTLSHHLHLQTVSHLVHPQTLSHLLVHPQTLHRRPDSNLVAKGGGCCKRSPSDLGRKILSRPESGRRDRGCFLLVRLDSGAAGVAFAL